MINKKNPKELRIWTEKVELPEGFPEPSPAMFHGPLGDAVRSVEELTEADPVGVLGSLLAEVSVLLGRNLSLEVSGVRSAARLFVMLVGPTAEGRKGTAGGLASGILDAAGVVRPEGFLQRGFASGESVVECLAKLDDRRVLYRQDEMAGLLVAMNREGSTLSPMIRDLWDGVEISHTTVSSHQSIADAHVAVLGHITPTELMSRLKPVEMANGLANRFLPLAVHRRQLVVWTGSKRIADFYGDAAKKLGVAISAARELTEFELTDAAFDTYKDIYRTAAKKASSMSARREPQILRLALIFAALDGKPLVDSVHLEAALAVWQYVEATIAWIYPSQVQCGWPTRAADIYRQVKDAGPNGLGLQELMGKFSGHLTAAVRDAAVEFLCSEKLVVKTTVPTKGRNRTVLVATMPAQQTAQSD